MEALGAIGEQGEKWNPAIPVASDVLRINNLVFSDAEGTAIDASKTAFRFRGFINPFSASICTYNEIVLAEKAAGTPASCSPLTAGTVDGISKLGEQVIVRIKIRPADRLSQDVKNIFNFDFYIGFEGKYPVVCESWYGLGRRPKLLSRTETKWLRSQQQTTPAAFESYLIHESEVVASIRARIEYKTGSDVDTKLLKKAISAKGLI